VGSSVIAELALMIALIGSTGGVLKRLVFVNVRRVLLGLIAL